MRALLEAIHAANGNAAGVRQARKFALLKSESVTPRVEYVAQRLGAGSDAMFSDEQIRARQIELGLV